MQTFVKRMIDEAEELKGRVKRLGEFINDDSSQSKFKKLSEREQELDKKQYSFMQGYLGVLEERISIYNK